MLQYIRLGRNAKTPSKKVRDTSGNGTPVLLYGKTKNQDQHYD
ncbi:hypothetical protein [Sphingobacterium sp. ML3W]|nr:hypothetical protein [Sphingobacterium sp. ML3W]